MLPRFYRFVKYSGRPDLAKVSEVNAVEFPRSGTEADPGGSELVPQTKTKGALAKPGTPAAKSVPAKFEGSRATVLDLQGHFQRLRTVWDPYTPVGLVQHPVKIVAGIDNSSFSESLLKIALPWAEKYRAKFISVHVLEGGRGEGEKAAIRSRLIEWMTDLSDPAGHASLQEVVLDPGDPAFSLVRFSHRENASLLIVGTHQREGKEKFLLGSVAEKVLNEALCPILVIPHFYPKITICRILVPHDGSHFSDLALAQGLILCHDFKADLWVIHGEAEPNGVGDEHARFLQKMAGLHWEEIRHETLSRPGEGPQPVLDLAQTQEIDFIIMSTHRRDQSQPFKESFTAGVIQKTPCPVLVVHP